MAITAIGSVPSPDNTQMQMLVMDATFRVRGYRRRQFAVYLVWILIALSLGTLGLVLLYWRRDWFLKLTHVRCSLADAEVVCVKDTYGQALVRKVRTMRKVRTQTRTERTEEEQAEEEEKPLHMYDDVGEDEEICEFRWFNYQKRKYWWDSKSMTFKPLIGPNVVKRENINTTRGMPEIDSQIRARLFGRNEICVNIEPVIRILILEALNPFYIFQLFSVILWYFEDYMYFACCIVVMSSVSCAYTIIQTRAMQRMLRDRFETSGEVTVLREAAAADKLSMAKGEEEDAKEPSKLDADDEQKERRPTLSALVPVTSSTSNLLMSSSSPTNTDAAIAAEPTTTAVNIKQRLLSETSAAAADDRDRKDTENDKEDDEAVNDDEFVTGEDLLDECRVIESYDGVGGDAANLNDAVFMMPQPSSGLVATVAPVDENGVLLTVDLENNMIGADGNTVVGGSSTAAILSETLTAHLSSAASNNANNLVTVIPGAVDTDELIITTPVGNKMPLYHHNITASSRHMPPSPLKRFGSLHDAALMRHSRVRLNTGQSITSAGGLTTAAGMLPLPPPTPTSPAFVTGEDADPREKESDEAYRTQVDSSALVPGDIFIIPRHGCEMFCDAVLLSGSCIVNESSLTGESVPVTKTGYTFDGTEPGARGDPSRLYYAAKNLTAKSTLFAGTTVIQTRYYGSEPVKALVMRTGFNTVKGELVRSILFPKPVDFTFYREAYKFLLALAGLASFGMIYSIWILTVRNRELCKVFLRALDLITIVVPPALPLALTVGIVHAQARMKKMGLFCISPRMINMAGSVNIVCFDKTGTLTEEGLNIRGVVPVENGRLSKMVSHLALSSISPNQFSSTHMLSFDTHLLNCMATCHSLTLIDGKLCGDPLDLEMWKAIDWELEEPEVQDSAKYDLLMPTVVRPKATTKIESSFTHEHLDDIGIVRVFGFESQLQRMSVITKHIHDDRYHLYAKGSPEMIASLCLEDTLPSNFQAVLNAFTQDGDRVLALAHRTLTERRYAKIQRLQRHALECELEFIGLLVFENRLKPQSIACIAELKAAMIRPVMVTGDNLLTALSVGRQCGIVDSSISVVEVAKDGSRRLKRHSVTPDGSVKATPNSNSNSNFDTTNTTMLSSSASATPMKSFNNNNNNGAADNNSLMAENNNTTVKLAYELPTTTYAATATATGADDDDEDIDELAIVTVGHYAVTGDTFDALKQRHPLMYAEVLKYGGIFARMSPGQKETLVEDLKYLGYFVGMCGDGANDCGALSAAHMGISLSDQEASAAATFTYKHANVSCVPTCIKEGRAALDASFGAFKFMAGYSLTQFISVLILYWKNTNLSDFQFLYIDMFEITIISLVFGSTYAYPRLVKRAPPTRLLAFVPMFSLLSQVAFIAMAQFGIYALLQMQPWYVPFGSPEYANATASLGAGSGGAEEEGGGFWSHFSFLKISICGGGGEETEAKEEYFSQENFSVYTLSAFQYIWLAIAFSRGLPYRRIFFTNRIFLACCIIFTFLNIYITLWACKWFVNLLELMVPPSFEFRLIIVIVAMANLVIAIVLEWFVITFIRKKAEQRQQQPEVPTKSVTSSTSIRVTTDNNSNNNSLTSPLLTKSAENNHTANNNNSNNNGRTVFTVDQEKLELGEYTPTIGGSGGSGASLRGGGVVGGNGTTALGRSKPSLSGV